MIEAILEWIFFRKEKKKNLSLLEELNILYYKCLYGNEPITTTFLNNDGSRDKPLMTYENVLPGGVCHNNYNVLRDLYLKC